MSNKIRAYNGIKYVDIITEPILKDGKETGHYIDLEKKQIAIDGIFDDEKVKNEVIDFINNMHSICKSSYYLLECEDHYTDLPRDQVYLFSSYTSNPDYMSLGEAIVGFLISLNEGMVESYHKKTFTYQGETIETLYFTYRKKVNGQAGIDNFYLFPITATTFEYSY